MRAGAVVVGGAIVVAGAVGLIMWKRKKDDEASSRPAPSVPPSLPLRRTYTAGEQVWLELCAGPVRERGCISSRTLATVVEAIGNLYGDGLYRVRYTDLQTVREVEVEVRAADAERVLAPREALRGSTSLGSVTFSSVYR